MRQYNKKILFICNTYMQLIAAIQIKRCLYKEYDSDILLSDQAPDVEKVVSRLDKLQIFKNVKWIRTKKYVYNQGKLQNLIDVITASFGIKNKYSKLLFDRHREYEYVFYYNYSLELYSILESGVKKSKKPVFCRMEEGTHSYANMTLNETCSDSGRCALIYKVRRILGKKNLSDITNDYYVFFDSLFPSDNGKIHTIPLLSKRDTELVEILKKCFDISEESKINEKYIFFGSSSEIDGRVTAEQDIIRQIANLVGKENFIVKRHPRDTRELYKDDGIKESNKSGVPWEVMQLIQDYSNSVFITMSSGSIISSCALTGESISTYFLYPIDEGKNPEFEIYCEESLKQVINKLKQRGLCLNHHITKSIEDIMQ